MEYKLSKGLWKGLKTILQIALAFAVFAGMSNLNLWDLVVQYIKPILSAMTVGGAITVALNYVKIKAQL